MSETVLSCCHKKIKNGSVWFLKDFKGYTARKLYIGVCSVCGDYAALQIMTSTANGRTYYNLYNGIEAVKIIYREKKRKVLSVQNVSADNLSGWIYGKNVQVKNKKGEIVQIRQYSADFNGNTKLDKVIEVD